MGSIDQPPEVLGGLIAGALVGTFLGVFLAYGFVGPFAGRVKTVIEEDHQFYLLVREVLVANLHNHSTNICIEVGSPENAPGPHVRPAFTISRKLCMASSRPPALMRAACQDWCHGARDSGRRAGRVPPQTLPRSRPGNMTGSPAS